MDFDTKPKILIHCFYRTDLPYPKLQYKLLFPTDVPYLSQTRLLGED